ncbi:hypothetical protein [Candidatus Poriferisodalis sp.]|uniref:hypothetical protein n=1 Tax=Candidatus Poriferisodalis sp. TaxID=3101277 RepID=UPI003B022140
MAAPRHVRVGPLSEVRAYSSPEVTPRRWRAERPGDLASGQPTGALRGHQGPDQGYAYGLVRLFDDRVLLVDGEHRHDVDAGCVAVALKRASIFGRAPVVWDLEAGYLAFGFLDPQPPAALVARRMTLFEGVAESHHYSEIRTLVACVPTAVLALTPADIRRRYETDPLGLTRDPQRRAPGPPQPDNTD